MQLSKKEYRALYLIYAGRTNLDKLKEHFTEEEIIEILSKFEKEGLIKRNYIMGVPDGFLLTLKGGEEILSKSYLPWHHEFKEEEE